MPAEKKAPTNKFERALTFTKSANVTFASDDSINEDGTLELKSTIDEKLNHIGDQIWEALAYDPDIEHSLIHSELKFEVKVSLKGEIEVVQREIIL